MASDARLLATWIKKELGFTKSPSINKNIHFPTSLSEFEKWQESLIKEYFNMDIYKNPKFDQDGNYVSGSGRLITLEEKLLAFDLLKQEGRIISFKAFLCIIDHIALDYDVINDLLNSNVYNK